MTDSPPDTENWLKAIQMFSCPFCGREAGRPCTRIEPTYSPPLPDLVKPHPNRLNLLTETDPAIRGSFARKKA